MMKHNYTKSFFILFALLIGNQLFGQETNTNKSKFKQLREELPTPNVYRTASGAPGHAYWQQQADYVMQITLDDDKQKIYGEETITYTNNSPDVLSYVWIQLDQNMRAQNSYRSQIRQSKITERTSVGRLRYLTNDFDGGFKIEYVKDAENNDLHHVINHTMMRVDLPKTLAHGEKVDLKIKWWYNINDRAKLGGRSGMEYFEDDKNYLYTIAQFFPRMAVYDDVEGWQNKQFLGRGEFAVPFGDYDVSITVPSDHVVASTGLLHNEKEVLSSEQLQRLDKAKTAKEPVMIVTEKEARSKESKHAKDTKTWIFKAENVRDFGFASSRKFIWDAIGVAFGDRTVMAMSFYPKEGNPLWEKYSTKAVAHTIRTYSKYTFDYPYPVAQSIHSNRIGMEYPMICFNGGRPEKDGTYSERTKYGMIGVIIHEVGHNFFPMIVNSDERQWTWMDEGLNTFLQYLTEQEWEHGYPSRNGPAYTIVDYMKGDKQYITPIMTNSESVFSLHSNAYGKPAASLNILRETVMGRELFDFAFKQYAQRWKFKHPTPADFFRTMEDASAVDLDWFFRGWYYTNDHVDIAITNVASYELGSGNPDTENAYDKKKAEAEAQYITDIRNKDMHRQTDDDKAVLGFYNSYDPYETTDAQRKKYKNTKFNDEEKAYLNKNYFYTQIDFKNIGGLVMPIILEFTYADGSKEVKRIPAEFWLKSLGDASKVFVTKKAIASVVLDPFLETADTDTNNNYWPPRIQQSRFQLYKQNYKPQRNPMQN